jgi:IS30 family transposase
VDRNSDWIEQTHAAHEASKERRNIESSRMRLKSKAIQTAVEFSLIKKRWTPERISGYLKKNHPDHYICDESIYQWIYAERKELVRYLPIAGSRQRAKRSSKKKSRLRQPAAPKVSIEERPEHINQRKDFGHWEADLIEGSRRSSSSEAVLSLLERKSRFSVYVKLLNKESITMYEALKAFFEDLPCSLRQSLTLDNGVENAFHYRLSSELNMQVYFCHSYASYEKGQVENSNRDFRKFVPKNLCLSLVQDWEIHKAERYRNTLPMKCLGFETPRQQFHEALTAAAH